MTLGTSRAEEVVGKLFDLEEELPPELRDEILSLGPEAVEPLVALLVRKEDVWHRFIAFECFHAAMLLAELRPPGAAEVVTRRLERAILATDEDQWVMDRLGVAAQRFGADIVEPMLAAYARAEVRGPARVMYAGLLSGIGVRDERIFQIVVAECEREPAFCGMLTEYGDPRGSAVALRALEAAETSSPPDAFDWPELEPAFEAVATLGGQLTLRLVWIRDTAREAWKRARLARAIVEGRTILD